MKAFLIILLFSCNLYADFSPEHGGNITISFNGVDCSSCSDKVEKRFKEIEGVSMVSVDPDNKKIYVSLVEGKKFSEDFIKKELLNFGYIFIKASGGYDE